MQPDINDDLLFARAAEMVRLLTLANTGNTRARSRAPMELLTMHTIPGRLRYAVHYWTYASLSALAKQTVSEAETPRLFNDLREARERITRRMRRLRICPSTRQGALLSCLLEQPTVTREMLAASANISTETAGRWLTRLAAEKVVVRANAGNISVYFVRDTVAAIIREYRRATESPADRISVDAIIDANVLIPMDPYRFRVWPSD